MVGDFIELDHCFDQAEGWGDGGKIRCYRVDRGGIERCCVCNAGIESCVVGRRAGDFHALDGLLWRHPSEAGGDGGRGGGAAVFSVVAMDVDRAGGERIAGGAGEFEFAGIIKAVVTDGEVDVADAVRGGFVDWGGGAVDGDDGLHTHGLKCGEACIGLGHAAGDEAIVIGDGVADAGVIARHGVEHGGGGD